MKDVNQSWMSRAIALAQEASGHGEVPVGAVLVRDEKIIGEGYNQPISSHDPCAHAEIIALRDAGHKSENYRLPGTTLYVTIEPCTMCVGALIHARIDTVVFGAREPKAGALMSNLQLHQLALYNHRLKVVEGVMANDCSRLMSEFFASRRIK